MGCFKLTSIRIEIENFKPASNLALPFDKILTICPIACIPNKNLILFSSYGYIQPRHSLVDLQ